MGDDVKQVGRAGWRSPSRRTRRSLCGVLGLVLLASTLSGCQAKVVMGGGRNFLGTNTLAGFGTSHENFWLAIGGYCSRREFGELIAARADNNGSLNDSPNNSCLLPGEGGPSYVRPNPSYNAAGYTYRVDTAHATGPVTVEIYDPSHCSGTPPRTLTPQLTSFRLYARPNTTSPETEITQRTFGPGDCTQDRAWWAMADVDPAGGPYFVQVTSPVPVNLTIEGQHNTFSLRAHQGAWAPCTPDATVAGDGVDLDSHCPTVSAVGAIGAYVSVVPAGTTMPVAGINPASAGRVLDVELFDATDHGRFIELLDPNGVPVMVQVEIGCDDGTYLSATGLTECATGELPPTANPAGSGLTYGPWTTVKFDNCGPVLACGATAENGTGPATQQLWGPAHLVQRTQYSNRTIRLTATLPSDYTAQYGSRTQWSVRFDPGASTPYADRITMKASLR